MKNKRHALEPNLIDDIPPPVPIEFQAGYNAGRYDGSEHDCRMFEPTVERAWESVWLRREREKFRGLKP